MSNVGELIKMGYQTTLGWSLLSSGMTTLLLKVLPGDSLWWGVALLIGGIATLFIRKSVMEQKENY